MQKKLFFSQNSLQKIFATLLIVVLLFSQTIRFNFINTTYASPKQYRDIVSIVVDGDTYRALNGKINRYAEDIQGYLGGTRSVIMITNPDTTPAMIAEHNEKLYYEGDGKEGKSRLVGTILIGNIPIPMVGDKEKFFPSIFPYVDFDNKVFIYNEQSGRYERSNALQRGVETVEIWHGVINPALKGKTDNNYNQGDIAKIGDFLDKTHNFYTESGQFKPSEEPPRVLFFDNYYEQSSVDDRKVFQHKLRVDHSEDFAYNRFNKHFLRRINDSLKRYDADLPAGADLNNPNINWYEVNSDTLTEDAIKGTPDIHTIPVTRKLVRNYEQIFSKKVLGEELLFVHNAGRYNSGALMRADLHPVVLSLHKQVYEEKYKKINDAVEDKINEFVTGSSLARKIPILDYEEAWYSSTGVHIPYRNYFFGKRGKNVKQSNQCTIARGTKRNTNDKEDRSLLVEASTAFDVDSTEPHLDELKKNKKYCLGGGPQIQTFWGGNSVLRLAYQQGQIEGNPLQTFPEPKTFSAFVKPIFSLGGMFESDRITTPSLTNCMDYEYQYTLKEPHVVEVPNPNDKGPATIKVPYPRDTDGTYFSCRSKVEVIPGNKYVSDDAPPLVQPSGNGPPITRTGRMYPVPIRVDENFMVEADRYANNYPCLIGVLSINGNKVFEAEDSCIYRFTEKDDQGNTETTEVDENNYRYLHYHTVEGIIYHTSPTQEELEAAEKNGATPSLPVDGIRSVEFLTKKGNVAKIEYPNFFKLSKGIIDLPTTEERVAELSRRYKENLEAQLNNIILQEQNTQQSAFEAGVAEDILGAKDFPTNISWNDLVSEEMIREMVSTLETETWTDINHVLSYNKRALDTTAKEREYEIAYLGLLHGPERDKKGDPDAIDLSDFENNYASKLAGIYGLNITEDMNDDTGEGAKGDECGPPEGVNIFKWPAAIVCWIKKQLPPKILKGKCGGDTIGKKKNKKNSLPEKSMSSDMSFDEQKKTLEGATVIPNFERKHVSYNDDINLSTHIQNDKNEIIGSAGTMARVKIISVTSEGKKVSESEYSAYFYVPTKEFPVGVSDPKITILTRGKPFVLTGRIVYVVPLLDGTKKQISSKDFTITAGSEFLETTLVDENGKEDTVIDTESNKKFFLNVQKKENISSSGSLEGVFFVDIFDDITGEKIISHAEGKNGKYELPNIITNQSGVYRIIVQGENNISGELTFSVLSGNLSTIRLKPVSSALIHESSTPVLLTLEDKNGNAVRPDIYKVDISVENGFIVDGAGNSQKALQINLSDSYFTFKVKTKKEGDLKIKAHVRNLSTEKEIQVLSDAQVKLQLGGTAKVGEPKIPARIVITNKNGDIIRGFNSVVSLKLPNGAGSFSKSSFAIKNGQSEDFYYTPGTISGQHNITMDIPGIGVLDQVPMNLIPGVPIYIDQTQNNGKKEVVVRDRYGNFVPYNGKGRLWKDKVGGSFEEITFSNGICTGCDVGDQFSIIDIPEIADNSLKFQENGKTLTVPGASTLVLNKDDDTKKVKKMELGELPDDYNALYTVLAGESFLKEGSDILFHSDKTKSQSLAVTTIMESPFIDDTVLSVFPGGGYFIGAGDDAIFESSLNVEQGYPVIIVEDSLRKTRVAKIGYKMNNAKFVICESDKKICQTDPKLSTIAGKLVTGNNADFSLVTQGEKLLVAYQNDAIFAVKNDGALQMQSGVTVSTKEYDTTDGLSLEITYQGGVIAEIKYTFAQGNSVRMSGNILSGGDAPTLQVYEFEAEPFFDKTFGKGVQGYTLKKKTIYDAFDDGKIGPPNVDSFGTLIQNPGVGWKGNNRTLLSFAAGDTVGEATKWFHTYMMINLGDPVAHVKHNAPGTEIDGLDRTIGTQIADGRRANISNFYETDMNADELQDIIVQYSDGYIELILNQRGKFRSMGNIAYLPRLGNSLLEVGDFQGDGFGDMVAVNNSGSLNLLTNNDSKFVEQDITVEGGSVPFLIQQMKVYDMDADGKDDIVYLTSYGELGILYGTVNAGNFQKKVLDANLGIKLKNEGTDRGGAILTDAVPQLESLGVEKPENKELGDTIIQSQVYYQQNKSAKKIVPDAPLTSTSTTQDIQGDNRDTVLQTYVRSQYASLANAEISKKFTSSNDTLRPEESVQVEITIKNSGGPMNNVVYLDSIPKVFSLNNTQQYSIDIAGKRVEKEIERTEYEEFNLKFDIGSIPAGSTAIIRYNLELLPVSYGEMLVGDFEKGLAGHDNYGDVAFKTSNTCGAEMLQWLSTGKRQYTSNTRPATFREVPLPKGIKEKIEDADGNGIPDSVENMTPQEGKKEYDNLGDTSYIKPKIVELKKTGKRSFSLEFNKETEQNIEGMIDDIFNGLSCGFGGGSCMSFPINWAPLAPGNDPVVLGYPIGDGLKVNEGIPVFSALTTLYTAWGPYPATWPAIPNGAGGYFGENAPYSSFVRMFVTPTLTLGMGASVCLGQFPSAVGNMPPQGLSPLIQGGNCIVMAKPLPICKGDGSEEDGDVSGISGLGKPGSGDLSTTEVWNGQSCNFQVSPTKKLQEEEKKLEKEIEDYMKSPSKDKLKFISAKISKKNISSLNAGPLLTIGNESGGGTEIDISVEGNGNIADVYKVINVKNKRIAAFPDFIMDWLTRQTEELTNSFFTPPNLTIIPPTDFGQNAKVDKGYGDFLERLGSAYASESFQALKHQMGTAYSNGSTASLSGDLSAKNGAITVGTQKIGSNTVSSAISKANGGLDAIRAAYKFIGKLPFIKIRQTRVNINVPWILPSELDQYERKLKSYELTIGRAMKNWCVNGENTEECLKSKAKINSGALKSSIQANLRRIEEYRKFPEKLQKYVTWKQKLMYDILCNIEAIEKMTFGWLKDNGIRFQKWAELYVLIKAIAESWQPLVDIFAQTNAQCGVCRNERWNSQQWKFKLISAIIPDIPVIKFPKWPDIVLDLSDVRLGIDIAVPDFNFKLSPIRLPSLPNLSLPNSPNLSITLPKLPVLPPLPKLPDLPRLPSLPIIKLPNLPSPPKLPKLGGAIKTVLNILKLISKMYCYYQNTFLIPEWQVGDVIAQRTERQGTLPMDFLNIHFPQFSLPTLREIRISTHVNFVLKSDFLAEFAKNAVKPINKFGTDLQKKIPKKIGPDVNTKSPINNVNIDLNKKIQSYLHNDTKEVENILAPIIAELGNSKDVFLDTNEFYQYFRSQLVESDLSQIALDLDRKMQVAQKEAEKLTEELVDYNKNRFNLWRQFLEEEEQKTAELQNIIDVLRGNDQENLLAKGDLSIGKFASKDTKKSLALQQLELLQNRAFEEKNYHSRGKTAYDIGKDLQRRIYRIAQVSPEQAEAAAAAKNVVPVIPGLEKPPVPYGYSPKFEGMYVLTEIQKKQTKLFDYTAPISKKDRVDVIDIDKDSDKDYIFLLGGILYVKPTHLDPNKIQKIKDTNRTIVTVGTKVPDVPNYFTQILSTPSELNITFKNTVPNETQWRMEFFDKYLEWDKVAIGTHDANANPKITVDLFLKQDFSDFNPSGVRSKKVSRVLVGGQNKEGFIIEGPKIVPLMGDIFISISPNRTLYTGNNDVDILYQNINTEHPKRMKLEANTAYQFDTTTDIRGQGGPVFIVGNEGGNQKYKNDVNFEGLPVVPGMKIISEKGFTVRDTTRGQNISFKENDFYMTRTLGVESDTYNFNISYPNGFYYARLSHLSENHRDRAGVELIAPRAESDSTSPVLSLSDVIKIPVYSTKNFALNDIITELSNYTVLIDVSTSVDENRNGTYDDDFITKNNIVSVTDSDIIFGPFDEPGKHQMLLKILDEFGNVTYAPITVDVFTPIPNLQYANTGGTLSGQIDVAVKDEPIDFFRIRGSQYPALINSGSVLTNEDGTFSSGIVIPKEEIIISSNSNSWKVNNDGIFQNLPNGFTTVVQPASKKTPTHINVYDLQRNVVYQQFLSLPRSARVIDMSDQNNFGQKEGIFVTPSADYKLAVMPLSDNKLSGGGYITDNNYKAVALITRDGNIYTIDKTLRLELFEQNNVIAIRIQKGDKLVAEVQYQFDFFYTPK